MHCGLQWHVLISIEGGAGGRLVPVPESKRQWRIHGSGSMMIIMVPVVMIIMTSGFLGGGSFSPFHVYVTPPVIQKPLSCLQLGLPTGQEKKKCPVLPKWKWGGDTSLGREVNVRLMPLLKGQSISFLQVVGNPVYIRQMKSNMGWNPNSVQLLPPTYISGLCCLSFVNQPNTIYNKHKIRRV